MPIAVEKFLQSSNGTGRKEKGLNAILATLKKQHSLFAELLLLPFLDVIHAQWTEESISLSARGEASHLENRSRSLFARMKVAMDENGTPGIPNLEPLSSFMSPNKPYRYTSEGLHELKKREMRSTDRQLLVRWFWVETAHRTPSPEDSPLSSCEVIIQFALANVGQEIRKRKRSEYENGLPSSPYGEFQGDTAFYLRNMNQLLEQMLLSQQMHYARVEQFLSSLSTDDVRHNIRQRTPPTPMQQDPPMNHGRNSQHHHPSEVFLDNSFQRNDPSRNFVPDDRNSNFFPGNQMWDSYFPPGSGQN